MSDYSSFPDFKARAGYEIGGVWYPRVTAIVGIKAKPGLYRYYASMPSFQAADEAKDRSAAEGTLVHEAVEAIMRGQDPVTPEVIRPSVDAFLEFLRNNDVKPLLLEERVVNRAHRYAGTIDMVAEVNGVVGVVDIKTGLAIYRDYGMQTSAYVAALREDPNLPQPATSWILRLDQCRTCTLCGASLRTKGGGFKVRGATRGCIHQWAHAQGEFEFRELASHDQDHAAFLAAKKLWEWEHDAWLKKLG